MDYFLHILVMIGIYVVLSVSLDLIVGYTGILSIAHAAFYGVGAYVAAILALKLQCPFLVSLICAVSLSGIFGALVGIPSLRIHGEYFVIATFAFQVIAYSVLNNWVSLTGGPMGLPGIPRPVIFGWTLSSHTDFLLLVAVLCVLTLWISRRMTRAPFGRVLRAIGEDEVFCQAIGKNPAQYKVLVFIVGAALAAVAGVTYAYYTSFIDPTSFTVVESVFIISIVIIGGAGSLTGPVIGSVVLVTLPEILRFIGLPSAVGANLRQIIYGGLLVAFMMWRPRGFLGKYSFQRKEARG